MQTYYVTAKRAHINYFDVVVAAMPILLFESRADPIRYMMGKSLDIETQLSYRDYWYYLQVSIKLY